MREKKSKGECGGGRLPGVMYILDSILLYEKARSPVDLGRGKWRFLSLFTIAFSIVEMSHTERTALGDNQHNAPLDRTDGA